MELEPYAYKPEIKDKWVLGLFECEKDYILSAFIDLREGTAIRFIKSTVSVDEYGNPYFCRYNHKYYLDNFIMVGD